MRQLKKVSNYPNYLHLENLTRKMSQKIWVYTYGYMGSKKPTSVRMIGEKESLRAKDKLANFESVEIQIFDIDFDKTTFNLKPKLLRKIRYLK